VRTERSGTRISMAQSGGKYATSERRYVERTFGGSILTA